MSPFQICRKDLHSTTKIVQLSKLYYTTLKTEKVINQHLLCFEATYIVNKPWSDWAQIGQVSIFPSGFLRIHQFKNLHSNRTEIKIATILILIFT